MLVANLNDRNDELRGEIASLERELSTLTDNTERGDVSVDELRADLRRVRLYAGIDPATGPGVVIPVRGPIDGTGVEDLVNELRNAGAEASPSTPSAGPRRGHGRAAGAVTVDGVPMADPFELTAIGARTSSPGP